MWSTAFEAFAEFVLLLLGGVVTLWPPASRRAKAGYLASFAILGLLNVGLTVREGVAADKKAELLSRKLVEAGEGVRTIREQTNRPPNVSVTVPAPVVQLLPAQETKPRAAEPAPSQSGPLPQPVLDGMGDEDCERLNRAIAEANTYVFFCRYGDCDDLKPKIARWQDDFARWSQGEHPYLFAAFQTAFDSKAPAASSGSVLSLVEK